MQQIAKGFPLLLTRNRKSEEGIGNRDEGRGKRDEVRGQREEDRGKR
jgi:hypothetical protein